MNKRDLTETVQSNLSGGESNLRQQMIEYIEIIEEEASMAEEEIIRLNKAIEAQQREVSTLKEKLNDHSHVAEQLRQEIERLREALGIAKNTCKDVTNLRRFSSAVDPVRWVEQLENFLEQALALGENPQDYSLQSQGETFGTG